jgi:hypothetical protein
MAKKPPMYEKILSEQRGNTVRYRAALRKLIAAQEYEIEADIATAQASVSELHAVLHEALESKFYIPDGIPPARVKWLTENLQPESRLKFWAKVTLDLEKGAMPDA